MPFPLIPVIVIASSGIFIGRKVAEAVSDAPPRRGYCSHCGIETVHHFHASGLTWTKSGPMAILFGTFGLAILSIGSRNVYKCHDCSGLTLPCRMPLCSGLAKSGQFYDDEFCGKCLKANDADASNARDARSQAETARLVELLRQHEEKICAAEAALAREQAIGRADKLRIAGFVALLKSLQRDRDLTKRAIGGAVA